MNLPFLKKPTDQPGENAGLMEGVAFGAVVVSAGLAGIGVSSIVGWESELAVAGSLALIAGTLFTELAASRLPVQAESRFREGRKVVGGIVVAGFLALTGWNVVAGHMGMVAINAAGVADKRAPLEAAAAQADARRIAAEDAVTAFDAATDRQADLWRDGLRGVDPRFVSAGTRRMQAAADAAAERDRERMALVEARAEAQAEDRAAEAAIAAAPTGRPDHELWAFALILELLKGALVWFCTPRRKRVEPISAAGVITIAPGQFADMSDDQLRAVQGQAKSVAASCQHELRRREKAAA